MKNADGFLGHPRGLLVLFATEGFSAFALYGLQSILVLALSSSLLQSGPSRDILGLATLGRWLGWDHGAWSADARAAMLAGLFGALVFVAPMAGGIIADRLLGHTRAVLLGRLGVFAGLTLLAFPPLFLAGLLLMVAGGGLANTTLAQLGGLYAANDPRRSGGAVRLPTSPRSRSARCSERSPCWSWPPLRPARSASAGGSPSTS